MILTEKQQKHRFYHLEKLIKSEYPTGKEILPSDQRKMIEQANFTSSHLGKGSEKEKKTIEDQGKKQTKAFEDHGNYLVESNELIKNDFNMKRDNIPLQEQKNIFNKLIQKRPSELTNLEKEISSDNLIYK